MNSEQKQIHYHWLDLIRFIAAFLVVAVHVRCEFFNTYSLLDHNSQNYFTQVFFFLNSFGGQAVIIFFVLSGFLVGGKNIERIISKQAKIKDYTIDRSVRILMPLIACLILIKIIDFFDYSSNHSFAELIGNLCGLQGVLVGDAGGVFWTLAYEIWFYIFIGSLICLFGEDQIINKIFGLLFLTLSIIVFTKLHSIWVFCLGFGVIAYFLSKKKLPRYIIILSLIIFIITWILIGFAGNTMVNNRINFTLIDAETLKVTFSATSAILISQLVKIQPSRKSLMKLDQYGNKLAVFSYSLYITHYQCCRIMHLCGIPQEPQVNITTIFLFILEILCCIIFGYLFYLITEKQTSSIKNYLKRI